MSLEELKRDYRSIILRVWVDGREVPGRIEHTTVKSYVDKHAVIKYAVNGEEDFTILKWEDILVAVNEKALVYG